MTHYVIFRASGEPRAAGTCPDSVFDQVIEMAASGDRWAVVDHEVTGQELASFPWMATLNADFGGVTLTPNPAPLGTDAVLGNLPAGTQVVIDGQDVTDQVSAGGLTLTVEEAGDYLIELSAAGYDPDSLTLTVTP